MPLVRLVLITSLLSACGATAKPPISTSSNARSSEPSEPNEPADETVILDEDSPYANKLTVDPDPSGPRRPGADLAKQIEDERKAKPSNDRK